MDCPTSVSPASTVGEVFATATAASAQAEFRDAVWAGLAEEPKRLPCKFFYDEDGSRLFERICDLPEYYPTRCETQLMTKHGPEIAAAIAPQPIRLVELGSGSSVKTRILLGHLPRPLEYMPVDISGDFLMQTAAQIGRDFPDVDVHPIAMDFTQPIPLPVVSSSLTAADGSSVRTVVYFPGSTIGNFQRPDSVALLARMSSMVGAGGGLLIGFDLDKDPGVLCRAYDDAAGVTAQFNLNLLCRINRELDGTFDVDAFTHRAVYNAEFRRVEMYLVSDVAQSATVDGRVFEFGAGEMIHTENSHKYRLDDFRSLLHDGGWQSRSTWLDDTGAFAVVSAVAVNPIDLATDR